MTAQRGFFAARTYEHGVHVEVDPALFRDGRTFNYERDAQRLNAQHQRVLAVMLDGQWHTLSEISQRTGDPEASVSARLRDLRKPRFGGYVVERRHVSHGLWEYRLVLP
ncbi:MAG TPA: hypothetical protein VNN10_15570 [Dehalococcoidia bacterium]|nr:hypothetical protein [Dehalococcoidia bacterium]